MVQVYCLSLKTPTEVSTHPTMPIKGACFCIGTNSVCVAAIHKESSWGWFQVLLLFQGRMQIQLRKYECPRIQGKKAEGGAIAGLQQHTQAISFKLVERGKLHFSGWSLLKTAESFSTENKHKKTTGNYYRRSNRVSSVGGELTSFRFCVRSVVCINWVRRWK